MSDLTWTKERREKLQMLRNEGLSYREIGRVLGVSRNAAIGAGKRWGLVDPIGAGRRLDTSGNVKPLRRPVYEPPPPPAPIEYKRIPLERLPFNACRYPLWGNEGGSPNFECCGNKGFPWCDYHRGVIKGKRVA